VKTQHLNPIWRGWGEPHVGGAGAVGNRQ